MLTRIKRTATLAGLVIGAACSVAWSALIGACTGANRSDVQTPSASSDPGIEGYADAATATSAPDASPSTSTSASQLVNQGPTPDAANVVDASGSEREASLPRRNKPIRDAATDPPSEQFWHHLPAEQIPIDAGAFL